jgi:hypothetical protein
VLGVEIVERPLRPVVRVPQSADQQRARRDVFSRAADDESTRQRVLPDERSRRQTIDEHRAQAAVHDVQRLAGAVGSERPGPSERVPVVVDPDVAERRALPDVVPTHPRLPVREKQLIAAAHDAADRTDALPLGPGDHPRLIDRERPPARIVAIAVLQRRALSAAERRRRRREDDQRGNP